MRAIGKLLSALLSLWVAATLVAAMLNLNEFEQFSIAAVPYLAIMVGGGAIVLVTLLLVLSGKLDGDHQGVSRTSVSFYAVIAISIAAYTYFDADYRLYGSLTFVLAVAMVLRSLGDTTEKPYEYVPVATPVPESGRRK